MAQGNKVVLDAQYAAFYNDLCKRITYVFCCKHILL